MATMVAQDQQRDGTKKALEHQIIVPELTAKHRDLTKEIRAFTALDLVVNPSTHFFEPQIYPFGAIHEKLARELLLFHVLLLLS